MKFLKWHQILIKIVFRKGIVTIIIMIQIMMLRYLEHERLVSSSDPNPLCGGTVITKVPLNIDLFYIDV